MWVGHGAPVTSITLSHILNAYLDLDKGKVDARLIGLNCGSGFNAISQ